MMYKDLFVERKEIEQNQRESPHTHTHRLPHRWRGTEFSLGPLLDLGQREIRDLICSDFDFDRMRIISRNGSARA
jgi:hypothetical protein